MKWESGCSSVAAKWREEGAMELTWACHHPCLFMGAGCHSCAFVGGHLHLWLSMGGHVIVLGGCCCLWALDIYGWVVVICGHSIFMGGGGHCQWGSFVIHGCSMFVHGLLLLSMGVLSSVNLKSGVDWYPSIVLITNNQSIILVYITCSSCRKLSGLCIFLNENKTKSHDFNTFRKLKERTPIIVSWEMLSKRKLFALKGKLTLTDYKVYWQTMKVGLRLQCLRIDYKWLQKLDLDCKPWTYTI